MSCCCHRMLHTEKARRDGRNNAAADCIITPHALCTPPIHHGPPILCHVAFQVPLLEGNHISYLTEAELGYRTCCSGWNVDRSSRSQSGYEAPGPGSLPFLLGFLGEHALQPVCTPAESHTSQLDDIAATPQTPHTPSGANPLKSDHFSDSHHLQLTLHLLKLHVSGIIRTFSPLFPKVECSSLQKESRLSWKMFQGLAGKLQFWLN